MPCLAKGFGGNADKLSNAASAFSMNLQIHRDSYVKQSATTGGDTERGIRLHYHRKAGQGRFKADPRILIMAIPALLLKVLGEVVQSPFLVSNALLFGVGGAHAPLVVAP